MSRLSAAFTHLKSSKAVSSILWLSADRLVRLVGGLVVYTLIAKSLGPRDFGILNYAIALVALANVVGAMGLNGVVVRDLVRDEAQANKVIASALCLRLIAGSAGLVLMLLGLILIRPGDNLLQYTTALVAVSVLFRPYEVLGFWFESQVNNRHVVLAESSAFVVVSILKIAMVVNNASVLAFAAAFSIETILASILMWMLFRKSARIKLERIDWKSVKYLFGESWPLLISGLTLVLYMRLDQIMIGAMLGDREVGIYSVASKLLEVWFFLPTLICVSVFPGIIRAAQKDKGEYGDRMIMLYGTLAAIALLVSTVTTVWGNFVIVLLFSEDYAPAGKVLSILMWASIFAFFGFASGRWYINEGLQKVALLRNMFGLIVAISLNIALIPSLGVQGAAWGTLAAYFCSGYLFDVSNKRTRVAFRQKTLALLIIPALRIARRKIKNV